MDREITAEDLKGRLTIEADFTGWSYGHENKLWITLSLDGEEISQTSTYIEPSGYERERND